MINHSVQRCDFRMHDIIDGKYRVERVLSTSQTYQTFKVVDSEGREYILKLYKLWEVEPRMRQVMLGSADSEIRSCQVKSNYLTEIVRTGTVGGNPYVMMEFCRSLDLYQCFGRVRFDLVKVAKEILYGLRDLHKSGKVHCRLTPENILMTEEGRIKLTNYVILGERSKVLSSRSRTLNTRFVDKSLAYQAPELFNVDRCSTILPTADIFSFGTILYQLVTGELPYGKLATESDWIHYQARAKSNDWNKSLLLRNDNREMWTEVLNLCLSSEPSARARNVDEILAKLPADDNHYRGVSGSKVEAPSRILNGVLLNVMQGDEFGQCYRLPELMQAPRRIITVGRADNAVFNMLQLPEYSTSYVSRRHCTIEYDDQEETWYVRDGQWDIEAGKTWSRSLNGTFVNSEEVTEEGHKIVPGDIISVGDIKLRVEAY